jgi:uncharacterized protein involved in exopolysaccharide biosynthesis
MEEKKLFKEIDIIKVLAIIVRHWRFLTRFAIAGAVIGIIVAFSIPKQYCSSVVLAPEFSSGTANLSSSLSELASSFGVNIGGANSSMDAIYPDLYPDIFASTEFIESLYDVPVRLKDDNTSRTYLTHLLKDVRTPWWNYPKIWLSQLIKKPEPLTTGKGQIDPYAMNRTQWEVYDCVSSSINCLVDKKTSVISISVSDQDPMVAAIMADTLQSRLQEYITNYRTCKARNDYEYYKKLSQVAKNDYEKARMKYAGMSDASTNIVMKSVELKLEDMENDMQLKFNVYTQSMTQLKLAEAKLQERTPAFTIIQPAKVNPKHINTPKVVIMLLWIFLSCLLGTGIVLWKEYKHHCTKA